jgi:adenosylmethionine---8-amino-7-oxononanoate aminotransferase
LICLSKALTGGYLPLGATITTEEIYQAFYDDDRAKTFFHGHSMTANPLACAVACASPELFETEKCLEKVAFINRKFRERFPKFAGLECVKDVRIIGAVGIIELNAGEDYLANIGQILLKEFLQRNILLRPMGNILYFMPPYIIKENEIDWILDEIESVLSLL